MRHRLAPAARLAALGALTALLWALTGVAVVAGAAPGPAPARCMLSAPQPATGGTARPGQDRRSCVAPESPGHGPTALRTSELDPVGVLPPNTSGAELPARVGDDRAMPRSVAGGREPAGARSGRSPPLGGSS